MTAASVLKAAAEAGITITVDGADLVLRSAATVEAGLPERTRSCKAEIRALLLEPTWSEEDWQALFDERAGILEFDVGFPRGEAEDRAAKEVAELRRQRGKRDQSSSGGEGHRGNGGND